MLPSFPLGLRYKLLHLLLGGNPHNPHTRTTLPNVTGKSQNRNARCLRCGGCGGGITTRQWPQQNTITSLKGG
ncbi:hypothetical protein AA18895_0932 [Acetobacter ghanensis DSM 18895]|nr:hypothetical protein AA18895_0932 [Acetobacter ghanensis DSM 18895]